VFTLVEILTHPAAGVRFYRLGPDGRPEECDCEENFKFVRDTKPVVADDRPEKTARLVTCFTGVCERPGSDEGMYTSVLYHLIPEEGVALAAGSWYWDSREAAADGHQSILVRLAGELG
jgi:hypothetical protein